MEALREDFGPVGAMEEMLVERIAVCYWRLRRALKAEVGEIRRFADNAQLDAMLAVSERFHRERQSEQLGLDATADGSRREMMTTTFGIQHLQEVLKTFRSLVDEQGFLTVDQVKDFAKVFGFREDTLGQCMFVFSSMATNGPEAKAENPEKWHDIPSPEKCKEVMLKLIDEEAEKIDLVADFVGERETLETEASALSAHLPAADRLEKILRYETTIERQLYRAVAELRSLQPARLGGAMTKRRLLIGMEEQT